jgi:hypothetical protein
MKKCSSNYNAQKYWVKITNTFLFERCEIRKPTIFQIKKNLPQKGRFFFCPVRNQWSSCANPKVILSGAEGWPVHLAWLPLKQLIPRIRKQTL